jgi:hypothetical protein
LLAGTVLGTAFVTLYVLAINRFDWGVALILAAPLVVWLLLRMGRMLERWAGGSGDSQGDPDFPEDADS